jgi:hypothetical protein
MVSTRHHPRPFPEPSTPSATTRASASPSMPSPQSDDSTVSTSKVQKRKSTRRTNAKSSSSASHLYVHKVPPLLMIWLYVSLPLVVWDTSYIALRPHSMPGGKLHSPIWTPYALYGKPSPIHLLRPCRLAVLDPFWSTIAVC